jgi:radical SAM superfamily enzyme YgiQ (UPF0313 family)
LPRLKLITIPWELEVPTLTLASLAAVTPPSFEIAIVDLLRERLVLDEPVDLVGITASTPKIKAAYALADLYRARGVTVVMGGHHVTALPEEALEHCDAVVCGEGETSWIRICDDFLSNPSRVAGIYRDPPPDLATLPQPRIDLLHLERYGAAFYYPLTASRGCPEACSFCFAKRMTVGYRTFPIRHVIEQIQRRPKFVRAGYFVDDNLPADPAYTQELFRALEKLGLPFGMQARHEFSKDPANVHAAKKAGCALISSGYESVNQLALDGAAKHATAASYREVIRNIFQAGIMPSGNWMLGFDDDGPDVFERTLEFLESTDMVHASFTVEIPFPGTAAWRSYREQGRILSDDYDDYVGKDRVVVRPKKLTPEQLTAGIRWLATEFYSLLRCTRRAARALENPRLPDFGARWLKAPALLALNYYQFWQWHYRMTPSLQWLYQRLIVANKYQYLSDFFRGTNYWKQELPRATPTPLPVEAEGPFADHEGFKRSRRRALALAVERPPAPR